MASKTRTRKKTKVPPQPVGTNKGLPLYASGKVPDGLMTVRQLEAANRRRTPGQQPRAYLHYRTSYSNDPIELYHVDDTRAVRPLSARQQAQKLARRTCVLCASVGDSPLPERSRKDSPWLPLSDRICVSCNDAAHERWTRTCKRCGTEFLHCASVRYGGCTACLEERKRGEEVARRLWRRHCPDCSVQTATREEIEAADAADFRQALGYPRTCEPCKAEQKRRVEEAERAWERERWDELGPVRRWARSVMAAPQEFAILDTETTGLGWDAKIVEISVTDGAGNTLLDTLVHPGGPIPEEATAIHGITNEDVEDADRFGTVLPRLTRALEGRRVIIYNKEYDTGVLSYELNRHHQEHSLTLPGSEPLRPYEQHPATAEWMNAQQWDRCAMLAYAVHVGDWSDYWGGWSWQKLRGGHRALGDCRTVVERIREMAERPDPF
ncbi:MULTISPECIES: exonuclease domain-containing protein [unclassified Streptomyces]|uniref:exonuclease domain-containing protein n=1 Tax=unclassified Streptomyces TaxID=2593676 RepID=UPI0035DE35C8